MGGCFSARMLAEHEEMRFHPDSSLFLSPLDVCFDSGQVAVVVSSDGATLRRGTCVWDHDTLNTELV